MGVVDRAGPLAGLVDGFLRNVSCRTMAGQVGLGRFLMGRNR
jgi:hypothetical protein